MSIIEQDQPKPEKSSRPHFLFVDDDLPILELFEKFFSNTAAVSLAKDGNDALGKITDQFYDAIISDVDMPVLNGMDLFRYLYAEDPCIAKRFVFCTGHPSAELERFCATHQVRCITKPVSLAALQKELTELCQN